MTAHEREVHVVDNRAASRYELTIDGVEAGYIDYQLSDNVMLMPYIQIDPAFGGRGFGGRLTQAALDDCRSRGVTVVPACPFIADYVRNHPEYSEPDGRDRRWFRTKKRSS